MFLKQKFTKNLLAIAVTLAVLAPAAHALEIKAEVSGTVDGVAFATDTDVAASGNVDVLDSVVGGSGLSDVFYHTYGSDTGNFGSRVSGNGTYDITGIFSYKETINNTTGSAQAYNFDFEVIPGELSLSGTPTDSGEFLMAEYTIDILVNGASIWNSFANVEKTDASSSATFTFGGTPLNDTSVPGPNVLDSAGFSSYIWGTYADSIALGVLGNGDSLDFEYILTSHAAGNVDPSNCFSGDFKFNFDGVMGGADGQEGDGFFGGEMMGSCGSVARSGDPFHFGGTGPNTSNITSSPTAQVSEPGSLALLGLGLVGVLANRRRKNKAKLIG